MEAFGKIFLEQARLKAELPPFLDLPVSPPDRLRFEQGVPLTSEEVLLRIPGKLWKIAADRLIPTMEHCFPKIFNELAIIGQAFTDRRLDSEHNSKVLARGLGGEAEATAADLGVSSRSLQFILSQIVKPLVARKAEALHALIAGLGWHKGYCPVCGSMPELSFTKQEVAAIGMVHLDLLAQEKGLLPAAAGAWNVVSSEDISSSPVHFGSRGLNS